ncbi:MAG: peptidase, partial [Rhodanobacter sp.]
MTKQYLKPLALAVSLALALTACGKSEQAEAPATTPAATSAATPAKSASVAPAAAAAAAAMDSSKSIFDVSELDPSIQVCQDFNGFVNNKWVAANPIPSDHTSWGAFDKLEEDSLNTQHDIVDAAAK